MEEYKDLLKSYTDDTSTVNLKIGVYVNNEGRPYVFPSVLQAERQLVADPTRNHLYSFFTGVDGFDKTVTELVLGADSPPIIEDRAFSIQTPGGVGALFLGGRYLNRCGGHTRIMLPRQGYYNYENIFENLGFTTSYYRYLNETEDRLDMDDLLEDLVKAPPSIVVLQGGGHNPTGIDPTREEWFLISEAIRGAGHIPFFDSAYLGLISGDPDEDAYIVRSFVSGYDAGFPLFLAAISFSKNFGLYGERIGALVVVPRDAAFKAEAIAQFVHQIRSVWNAPSKHPGEIVRTILMNPTLRVEWLEELRAATAHLAALREGLHDRLVALGGRHDWSYLRRCQGMYVRLDLTADQVAALEAKGVLVDSGRMSVASLTLSSLDRVAEALSSVVEGN